MLCLSSPQCRFDRGPDKKEKGGSNLNTSVFVGKLDKAMGDDELAALFAHIGGICSATVKRHGDNKSKKWGYCPIVCRYQRCDTLWMYILSHIRYYIGLVAYSVTCNHPPTFLPTHPHGAVSSSQQHLLVSSACKQANKVLPWTTLHQIYILIILLLSLLPLSVMPFCLSYV